MAAITQLSLTPGPWACNISSAAKNPAMLSDTRQRAEGDEVNIQELIFLMNYNSDQPRPADCARHICCNHMHVTKAVFASFCNENKMLYSMSTVLFVSLSSSEYKLSNFRGGQKPSC